MDTGDDRIKADYNAGADGPTILMSTSSLQSLGRIRDVFLELAQGREYVSMIEELDVAHLSGMSSLCCNLVPGHRIWDKSLEMVEYSPDGARFVWSNSAEGWLECAELIEGIEKGGRPGHQYFTAEGMDDAIVVVSYRERIKG